MASTKQTVRAVLDTLPEDCTIEDVQYQLYLRHRITKSRAAAAEGRLVSHDEVKQRLAMGRKVVWTVPAADDLVVAVEFIARDSAAFAATLAERVCEAGDNLAEVQRKRTAIP